MHCMIIVKIKRTSFLYAFCYALATHDPFLSIRKNVGCFRDGLAQQGFRTIIHAFQASICYRYQYQTTKKRTNISRLLDGNRNKSSNQAE